MSSGVRSETAIGPHRLRPHAERVLGRLESRRLAWPAIWLALLATGLLLLYLTRRTYFLSDEWLWITQRRGTTVGTFLDPYNGHLSLVPIAIYKVLFATAGLRSYVSYRLVIIAAHLGGGLLVYVYAKRRVGEAAGLLAASLILVFGPGWEDILWPFQIAWSVAIMAGIGALLMLDRGDRRGDLAACLLIALALASTSVGLAIALGIAVETGCKRRRLADAWIVGVPLLLYAVWWVADQQTTFYTNGWAAVRYVADSASVSLGSLLGLSGITAGNLNGDPLTFGAPLTVAAAVGGFWLWRRRGPWAPRAISIAVILAIFWILTGVTRSALSGPESPRYLYVDAIFVVLLGVELARGWTVRWQVLGVLAVIAAVIDFSNIGALRTGAGSLRYEAQVSQADVAALNLNRAYATGSSVASSLPGYPLVAIRASDVYAAERALGPAGDTIAELTAAPDYARQVADAETVHIRGLVVRPSAARSAAGGGVAPTIEVAWPGTASTEGGCTSYAAAAAGAGAVNRLQLLFPPAGVKVTATGGPASVGVRRFAQEFQPVGTVPAGTAATLQIGLDPAPVPWHLQVVTSGAVRVCTIAAAGR